MAGMEQLEIHSRSYLVRWVHVAGGHTISWSIQPHKKSINFGIFKHPGTANGLAPNLPSGATVEPPSTPGPEGSVTRPRGLSSGTSRNDRSSVVEKLQGMGYKSVCWFGKCDADKVSVGRYDVPEGEGGNYGLVFDNTFSKQVSKTATFVLMTFPTNAPPKSGHSLQFSQAFAAGKNTSPQMTAVNDSAESLPHELNRKASFLQTQRPRSSHTTGSPETASSSFFTGILQKKRRKKGQGFANRFFSLDFQSNTLSYYRNSHSSALRGVIPLSLAFVTYHENNREFSIDSGAEVWHLRAKTQKDFLDWKHALEKASSTATNANPPEERTESVAGSTRPTDPAEEAEWDRIESLVGRVVGSRDAVRRLAKDTDPKYATGYSSSLAVPKTNGSNVSSPVEEATEYIRDDDRSERSQEKVPFWKRKPSSSGASPSSLFRRSVSAQLAVPAPSTIPPVPPLPNGPLNVPKRANRASFSASEEDIHGRCMEILQDLDAVVAEFSALLAESRHRRSPPAPNPLTPRKSMDSASSDEFFDATDTATVKSGFLTMHRDSEESVDRSDEVESDGESDASSEQEEGIGSFDRNTREGQPSVYPPKPKSLTPLPLEQVKRRNLIPPAKVSPPSLIGFLRKNVGKDLSTIAMPVSANEPTSLLQRVAEQMEYSELLDAACNANGDNGERLLYIAAFAISTFSNSRVKERAIRKPFNPMLGETFELVREDKGFRFICEKVSHRPVRMACQAEAANWTFLQSPMPVQKFWGKSAELNTEGRARVVLYNTNEHYSWSQATSFLRNIIAGEKYVEPVGTMTVIHEDTGAKAVATFKAGGMWAGRSEDVKVEAFDAQGNLLPLGLTGKWTSHLNYTQNGSDSGKPLWTVGPLVDNAPSRYGLTVFAASLNEITPVEKDHLPPTDSRLRPDQRAVENGDLDRAEALKAKLEERQRQRRRVMEEHGDEWKPRWFVKSSTEADGEEVWKLKNGKDGYWEERARGEWSNVVNVLEA